MLEWLIVGGGVHGTYLSHVLTTRGGIARDRVRVLDPHSEPLARWNACTDNVGMAYLRSSFVHHLGLEPYELRAFAKDRKGLGKKPFLGRYLRPSLRMFREHTQQVVQRSSLASMRVQGHALALVALHQGMRVETENGSLEAKRVLLAMGMSDHPEVPDFAQRLRSQGAQVHHVFEPSFSRSNLAPFRRVVVVGGGISAAQTALAISQRPDVQVTLISRHPWRVRTFDTDPAWMGPKNLTSFARVADYDQRRQIVRSARYVGSMPDEVANALRTAIANGTIRHRLGNVVGESVQQGEIHLESSDAGGTIVADCIVLATGFQRCRPGGAWLERTIAELGLRCASCGFPVVGPNLQWHSGIFVTGPLAELELGPPARNILGARMAGERLTGG